MLQCSSVRLLSRIWLFVTSWTAGPQASLEALELFHHQFLEFTQTHVHRVGDAIQPSHPVLPFSSCLQSFPASESFQMSQLSTSCGQSIGVWASTSVPPVNTQDWSPLGWTGWISLQESSPTPQFKSINSSVLSFLYSPTLTSIHDYWKHIALTRWILLTK